MTDTELNQQDNHRVTIGPRFCGPPTSGNGGYSCGLLGHALGGCVEVTLLKPPPLEVVLRIEHDDEGAQLLHDETEIAKARPAELDLAIPSAPSFEEAVTLSSKFAGFEAHAFPTCFVCGPERDQGDGLCIFPGRASPEAPVAAAWTPDASLCDDEGLVLPEIVWSALDCPGYFAIAEVGETAVLGRMTASINKRPRGGEPCVVLGWAIGRDGRKLHAGTALFGPGHALYASAKQTWIKLS